MLRPVDLSAAEIEAKLHGEAHAHHAVVSLDIDEVSRPS